MSRHPDRVVDSLQDRLFNYSLPDDFQVGRRVARWCAYEADGTPAVTLFSRLLAFWGVLWAGVATIICSILEIVNYFFSPSAVTFKRWATLWARSIMRPMGLRTRVLIQFPEVVQQPCIFIANHQCALDILALADGLPYPFGFVAKSELAEVPFLGQAIRYSASLFIDQRNPRRALKSLQEAGRKIRAGNSVLIFPEGHRTYSPCVQPFKRGAFMLAVEAQVPLVPVVLLDSYRYVDERKKVACPGEVHVVVGKPVDMAGKSRRDIPEIMHLMQQEMQMLLQVAHRGKLPCPSLDENRNPAG